MGCTPSRLFEHPDYWARLFHGGYMDRIGIVYTATCRPPGCRWREDCLTEHLAQLVAHRHEREQEGHRTCVLTLHDRLHAA